MRLVISLILLIAGVLGLRHVFTGEPPLATDIEITSSCTGLDLHAHYFVDASPVFAEAPTHPGPEYDAMFSLGRASTGRAQAHASSPSRSPDHCSWTLLSDRKIRTAQAWEFSPSLAWKSIGIRESCQGTRCRSRIDLALTESFHAVAIDLEPMAHLDYSTLFAWINLHGEWIGGGRVELHVGPQLVVQTLQPSAEPKVTSADPLSYSWELSSGSYQHFHSMSLKAQDPRRQQLKEVLILIFSTILSLGGSGLWATVDRAQIRAAFSYTARRFRHLRRRLVRIARHETRRPS
jgi:hypothetical protein